MVQGIVVKIILNMKLSAVDGNVIHQHKICFYLIICSISLCNYYHFNYDLLKSMTFILYPVKHFSFFFLETMTWITNRRHTNVYMVKIIMIIGFSLSTIFNILKRKEIKNENLDRTKCGRNRRRRKIRCVSCDIIKWKGMKCCYY